MTTPIKLSTLNLSNLSYDKDTGLITNLTTKKQYTKTNTGYVRVFTSGVVLKGHRVAWFLHYGSEPEFIDHLDGDRANNRISNLKSTSHKGNMQNRKRHSKSRLLPGVEKATNYKSYVQVDGKKKWIGTYSSEYDAHIMSTYYKMKYYANYQGRDLPLEINGVPHPYFNNTINAIVKTIVTTKG